MNNINVDLLSRVCEAPGAPGFESRVRNLIIEEIKDHVDECEVDNLGSVYAIKRAKNNPSGIKVMVAAHMDEIGFVVTHIDENGFIRFNTLGGFDAKTLTAQRVIVHGRKDLMGVMGTKPIHVMSAEERQKLPKVTDYYVDMGMSKDEVSEWVSIGDPITRERGLIEMGNCVNCKSLDNRVSVFVLIEALKKLDEIPYDVYGVFTVQEEVGLRGAKVAAHRVNPDFALALDTTIAFDLPGSQPHEQVTRLGEGTAIKILDASAICDYRMVSYLKQTAEKNGISWQPEILVAGGTDTAGLQQMGKNGAIAGAISIPTRHLHQVIEMANKDDIADSIDLLVKSLSGIDAYDWKHL